jgi:phosphate:Na+ symporter
MESTNAIGVLQIGSIIMGLFGGLALFLFGMEQMTDALKSIAGRGMKNLLARLTTNRLKAVFAGAFVTAIIQSSSVTTVLTVGFVSAGLLTLRQSIGIIMGAEIGTTVTAQIIAFKVTQYALILVALGFGLQFLAKRKRVRLYGLTLLGFGLIFFGMNLMSEATHPLQTFQPFIDLMQQINNPVLAILISAVFTGIVQSSSATIGLIIVLASQGFITLEAGIALTLGANIGTSVTALLASIGKPREAVRTALIHILFNVIGVILWFGLIDHLAALVRWLSPAAPQLVGVARLAAETPRQIANAHTIFNATNTLIFIWFITPLAWLVRYTVPERPLSGLEPIEPKYLDDHLLQTPDLALERVRLEIERLGKLTVRMVRQALPTVFHGSEEDLAELARMDDDVDRLYAGIVTYLRRLSREDLLPSQSEQLANYMAIANDIENIGDMIETNLVDVGGQRLKYDFQMSEPTQNIFRMLHDKVCWAVENSIEALVRSDERIAKNVTVAKPEINRLADKANRHLARRLIAEEPNRINAFRIESELVEYLKRVYYFAKRIARVVVGMETVKTGNQGTQFPEELVPAKV